MAKTTKPTNSGNQSEKVYARLIRRDVPLGDVRSRSNSISLNSLIEPDHRPREYEYIPGKPPKSPAGPWNPGRMVSRPGNADEVVVANARRAMGKLKTRTVTRYQPEKKDKLDVGLNQATCCGAPPWERD